MVQTNKKHPKNVPGLSDVVSVHWICTVWLEVGTGVVIKVTFEKGATKQSAGKFGGLVTIAGQFSRTF